jgi:Arc/MetJ-type ribon-helix-helix transcriptional regulator
MDDERITLRMGTRDVQMMDEFLEEHSELGWSRSQFIRAAIAKYIKGDVKTSLENDKADGTFVRLPARYVAAMRLAVDRGMYNDEGDFIVSCLRKELDPDSSERNGHLLDAVDTLTP